MKEIIGRIANTNIFWSADFKNYAEITASIYSEIGNITNYHHFRAVDTSKSFFIKINMYVVLFHIGKWINCSEGRSKNCMAKKPAIMQQLLIFQLLLTVEVYGFHFRICGAISKRPS